MPCDYPVITFSGDSSGLAELRAPLCRPLPLWRGRVQLVWRITLKVDVTGRGQKDPDHSAGHGDAGQTLLCLPRCWCVAFVTISRCHEKVSALHLSWACPEDGWERQKLSALETWPRALILSGLILHMSSLPICLGVVQISTAGMTLARFQPPAFRS